MTKLCDSGLFGSVLRVLRRMKADHLQWLNETTRIERGGGVFWLQDLERHLELLRSGKLRTRIVREGREVDDTQETIVRIERLVVDLRRTGPG